MDGQTITTSTKPSDISYKDVADTNYVAGGNRVVDFKNSSTFYPIADYAAAINTAHASEGRSSIKYTNE